MLIIGIGALIRLNNKDVVSPFRYLTIVPGLLMVILSAYLVFAIQDLSKQEAISTGSESLSRIARPEHKDRIVDILRKTDVQIDNEMLILNAPDDIYKHYSPEAQGAIDKLFASDPISKDFALTLIGKKISQGIKTVDGRKADLSKGKYVIAVLNQGDYSKKAIKTMNDTKYLKGAHYLAYFPMDDKDTIKSFYEETNLDKRWIQVSEQKDFAINDLNIVGAPSFIAIENGKVTLAINNYELYTELFMPSTLFGQ